MLGQGFSAAGFFEPEDKQGGTGTPTDSLSHGHHFSDNSQFFVTKLSVANTISWSALPYFSTSCKQV
jgi:hypothetical protein